MLRQRPFLVEVLTALGLIAAPFVLPHLGFTPTTINRILVWGLFGIGFDILFGFTGLLSFGQSAFFGTGGMVAAYLLTVANFPYVMPSLAIGTIVAAVVGYLVGLIALRRTGIYFAMITVAIAEVFYFVEFNPLSAYTGGENGLPGVPTPSLDLGFTTINFNTDWSLYAFLAFWFFVGIVIALRIVRSPVGADPARHPRQSAARRRGRPQYPRLQADGLCHCCGLCGLRRRPARRDAGLHAAGCLHVRYLRPARDADRDRRRRHAVRAAGRRCRVALSERLPANHAASRRHLEAGARRDFRAADLLPAPRTDRRHRGSLRACGCAREAGRAALPTRRHRRRRAEVAAAEAAREPAIAAMPARRRETDRKSGPILQAKGLTKHYGGLVANSDIDFVVNHGELRGIIGPNGAGKTHLLQDADLRGAADLGPDPVRGPRYHRHDA